MISLLACVSWRFCPDRTSLPHVSYKSSSSFLGGVFHVERSFTRETFNFVKEPLGVSSEVSGSSVSNEILPSDRCPPNDMFSEFESEARRSGMMEGSDWDCLYFFKKMHTQNYNRVLYYSC